MQLNAQKQNLAGLLGGLGYQLIIPPYQRPYAWGREQVDDLWDDVMAALGTGHFMGSIVLNAEDDQRPQVIDGQQRLTTLLLLIRLLQDRYLALGSMDRAEPLYMLLFANPFADGDARYRLRTGDANWQVFRDYVLRRHDDPLRKQWENASLESRATRSRNQALFENARVLSEKLDIWLAGLESQPALERLDRLQQTLIQRLEFVVVAVGSAPDAFLLFETLNDRGLQLSQGDLLKNHLLSRVAADSGNSTVEVEEVSDEWEGLLEDLGAAVDVTRFLRHFLLAISFPVKKEQVFDRFKAQVASTGARSLLHELREFGKLYGQFADPARVQNDPVMQTQLRALAILRAESCYPALLMARRYLPRAAFLEFARLAEILTYRYSSVCGLNAQELQAVYHRAARILSESKGADLGTARDEIVRMLPGTAQFTAAFRLQRVGAQYLARYTLQCLEQALNPGKEFKTNEAVHIEHVMPQHPSEEWKASLGENLVDHPAYVQRWGNLTLLHAPLNIGASNNLFAAKQARYAPSEVSLTNSLCSYLRWGLDAIDQRQRWMAEIADRVWSISGLAGEALPALPLQITSALSFLEESERHALERLIPASADHRPNDLADRIREHEDVLAEHHQDLAGLGSSLLGVLARWDELGLEGRRLVVGGIRYYVEVADAVDDREPEGLLDDIRVVRAVCSALSMAELAPDL